MAAALVAGVGTAGCASAGTRSDRTAPGGRAITQEELATLSVSTAYDAIERLRPLWLRSAGPRSRSARLVTEIVVITDGQYFGTLASLRQIPAPTVREIRYMTGSDATNAFPSVASGRHIESAIIILIGREPSPRYEEAR